MRHQTYELNMGRPLPNDFKAAIREQFKHQVGHEQYRIEIAYSWIRKDLERRSGASGVLSPNGIVGANNYRTPYVLTMTTVEHIIREAYEQSEYLHTEFPNLDSISLSDVSRIGQFLFDFYQGVKLSIGAIHPGHKSLITDDPIINSIDNYWDLAKIRKFKDKQRLVHNVGLRSVTRAFINKVMREGDIPDSPQEVADKLVHLKGIPWASRNLLSMKDDWVPVIEESLRKRYDATRHNRQYTLELVKRDESGNPLVQPITVDCLEF